MKFLLAIILLCVGGVSCTQPLQTVFVPNVSGINFNSFIYPKQKVFNQIVLRALSESKKSIGKLVARNRVPVYEQIQCGDLYLDLIADTQTYIDPKLDVEHMETNGYNQDKIVEITLVINEKTWTEINKQPTQQNELSIKIGILTGLFIAELCAGNSTNTDLYRYLNSIVNNLNNKTNNVLVTPDNQVHIKKILEGIYIFVREYEKDFNRKTKLPISTKNNVDRILQGYIPKPIQIA